MNAKTPLGGAGLSEEKGEVQPALSLSLPETGVNTLDQFRAACEAAGLVPGEIIA